MTESLSRNLTLKPVNFPHRSLPSPQGPNNQTTEDFKRRKLDAFLEIGHARECWCGEKPTRPLIGTDPENEGVMELMKSATGSESADNFENIQGDEDMEDGWTVVVPEVRYGKIPQSPPFKNRFST